MKHGLCTPPDVHLAGVPEMYAHTVYCIYVVVCGFMNHFSLNMLQRVTEHAITRILKTVLLTGKDTRILKCVLVCVAQVHSRAGLHYTRVYGFIPSIFDLGFFLETF